ncbi:MAG: hypothetical protein K0R17_3925 [Rariglobus sp.]|jgi:tetratricopeptide (TPR) repeat protein|nr:hypothetical protein [Rariglobus sp.]
MRILTLVIALFVGPFTTHAEDHSALLKTSYGYGMFTFGMHKVAKGETKEARAAFQIALENAPSLGRASFHLGDTLFGDKDFEGASDAYLLALQKEPDYFFASYNLACAAALLNQKARALANLESAMGSGYNRYDKIPNDPDFAAIKDAPEFPALIEKFRSAAKTPQGSVAFLLASEEAKAGIANQVLETKDAGWRIIADKALLDSSHVVRIYGLALYDQFGNEERLPILVRSLFDNNGYVNKFAGNGLVKIGPAAIPYMDAILASDFDHAKFYARQIKQLITGQAGQQSPSESESIRSP